MSKARKQLKPLSRSKGSKAFIKIVEIWKPSADQKHLCLQESLYDGYENFHQQSQNRRFRYDEGLPGKAWSSARPQIFSNIAFSFFRRKHEAIKAGLSSAIAIPIFAGEFLQAVVILLCGEDEHHTGAMELWGSTSNNRHSLSLIDSYYGKLKTFEWVSQKMCFNKGEGLPGSVWQSHTPQIIPDLGSCTSFVRHKTASESGISTGLGIPFRNYRGEEYALTFLSAMDTPIARRFEIWIPDEQHNKLILLSCHNAVNQIEAPQERAIPIQRGKGLMGLVWMTGSPAISHDLEKDALVNKAENENLSSALVMPINDGGKLKAMVNFLF